MPLIETFGGGSAAGYNEFRKKPFSYTQTGGTLTQSGGYNILTWTGNGNFTITSGKAYFDTLVVGAGGGGGRGSYFPNWNSLGSAWGAYAGGGGGSGAALSSSNTLLTANSYSITVGSGGRGGWIYYAGSQYSYYYYDPLPGQSSSFNGVTANGGQVGNQGGFSNSGGTSGSGYSGGSSSWDGGGGGASGAGSGSLGSSGYTVGYNAGFNYGGGYLGGAGVYSSISGSGLVYARGGNAPNQSYTNNPGQAVDTDASSYSNGGNGGSGAWSVTNPNFGTISQGGSGANGVVVIRWKV